MPYYCKLFFICVIDIEEQPLLPLINLYHNCVWKNQLQLAHFVNSKFLWSSSHQLIIFMFLKK